MRGAGKNENSKLRSNCGAATSGAEERALSGTADLSSLLANFGWH